MDLKVAQLVNRLINQEPAIQTVPGVCWTETCTLTGSRAYGLETGASDYDLVAVHVMNPTECFEHPDFRTDLQVIRRKFGEDLVDMPMGEPGGMASLDSFELWKFVTLWLKGAFVSYEILCTEPIMTVANRPMKDLYDMMRSGLTNRIGKAAKGVITHDWRKCKQDRKKAIMAFYRPLQAVKLLHTGEFEVNARSLWQFGKDSGFKLQAGEDLLSSYLDPQERKVALKEKKINEITEELVMLDGQLERSVISTKFPDQVPKKILESVLQEVVRLREFSQG